MKKFIFVYPGLLVLVFIIYLASSSCTHPVDGLSKLDSVCFDPQVMTIVQISCAKAGCHDGSKTGARHTFKDYASIRQYVTPGQPKNSRFYTAISSGWSNLMPPPPNLPLTEEQRSIIYVWIEQGAQNRLCY
ncbi:MAG: hypothetical protein ABSG15_15720 [FCB group bacterium]|jgi:uncharacterized membrane protein